METVRRCNTCRQHKSLMHFGIRSRKTNCDEDIYRYECILCINKERPPYMPKFDPLKGLRKQLGLDIVQRIIDHIYHFKIAEDDCSCVYELCNPVLWFQYAYIYIRDANTLLNIVLKYYIKKCIHEKANKQFDTINKRFKTLTFAEYYIDKHHKQRKKDRIAYPLDALERIKGTYNVEIEALKLRCSLARDYTIYMHFNRCESSYLKDPIYW